MCFEGLGDIEFDNVSVRDEKESCISQTCHEYTEQPSVVGPAPSQ